MQENSARDEEILLCLSTISSAVSSVVEQRSGPVEFESSPHTCPKPVLAYSKLDLPLPVEDQNRIQKFAASHLQKLQGLKKASGPEKDKGTEGVKATACAKEIRESGKSRGGSSRKSVAQVETKPNKESTGSQGGGCEVTAAWQSKCDLVIFPRSAMQVCINQCLFCCAVANYERCENTVFIGIVLEHSGF